MAVRDKPLSKKERAERDRIRERSIEGMRVQGKINIQIGKGGQA